MKLAKICFFFVFLSFCVAPLSLVADDNGGSSTQNSDGGDGKGNSLDTASEGVTCVICKIIKLIQGPSGKTIAILVVISLAIGLFLGKITWGVAIAVSVGMGVLFGANTLVGYVSGTEGDPCKTCKDGS